MLNQLKYEWKARAGLRIGALAGFLVLHVFTIVFLGIFGILGYAGEILGVVLSSVALTAMLVIALINDIDSLNRLFYAPSAYLNLLTPVKPWKQLLSRILFAMVQDIVFLFIGVVFLLIQVEFLTNEPILGMIFEYSSLYAAEFIQEIIFMSLFVILGYFFLILVIYFGVAMVQTIFSGIPGRKILGFLSAMACLYLFPLIDIVLYPLNNGDMYRYGALMTFTIDYSSPIAVISYFMLMALKCAGLFFLTTKLMERKLNV